MSRLSLLASVIASVFAAAAHAQPNPAASYPAKPVRIIVSVPAGGGVDAVTRIYADRLTQKLGQPFVIENRGGAGGNVGAEAVFSADPDGHMLLASQPAPLTTNVALYKKLNFDPAALEPVAIMSRIPNVLLVKNGFPARDAREFLAYVRANPGRVNYASQGVGTTSHLTGELFVTLMGTKLTHVPYRGTGPALNDLLGGVVDMIFMELSAAYKLHDAGKARILAVATAKRLEVLPDMPTMMEVGVPDLVSDTWNAISAPPRTPQPVVMKLNQAMNEVMAEPAIRKRFSDLNLLPGGGSPADMRRFIAEESRRWIEVIRRAGIQPE